MDKLLFMRSWPSVILHLDADAFFASVEQAIHPHLKGKPVIAGAERGIVAAASYEAKALGITRGLTLGQAKKICPSLVCLPSDYETYSIFSKRIFAIMRRFTPVVEEYSIDEAFADLSGLRRVHRCSYERIAIKIKTTVESELGITVSVGLSLSKSLAKLASKWRKPSGLTIVPGRSLHHFLKRVSLEQVWGFGPNTVSLLKKMGLVCALDYVRRPEVFAKKTLGKIGVEIHKELSGTLVYPVIFQKKTSYVSISKMKTWTPPSDQKDFVYAQALRNLEKACLKARRYQLSAKKITLILRRQNFENAAIEIKLARPTAIPLDLIQTFKHLFQTIYRPQVLYRATGVILGDLSVITEKQLSLFEDPIQSLKTEKLIQAVDQLNHRYGKHKIHLADSLPVTKPQQGIREKLPARKKNLLKGENLRQHLRIPLLES